MKRKELINKIAKASNLKKGEVKRLLSAFSQAISESLARGEKVTISGFGSFVIPQQRKTAHFRASKKLKDEIKRIF